MSDIAKANDTNPIDTTIAQKALMHHLLKPSKTRLKKFQYNKIKP